MSARQYDEQEEDKTPLLGRSNSQQRAVLHTVRFSGDQPQREVWYGTDGGYSTFDPADATSALEPHRIIYCLHGDELTACDQGCLEKLKLPEERRIDPHCHVLRTPGINQAARKKLIIASVLCLFFMVAEAVGGYLSNSIAIATDAAHLLADFASFMISLFSLWIASRPATSRMSFGWHRAEVMGALVSVLLIWVVTGILVYMAAERIINQNFEIEPVIMLITSGLGVVVNIIMGCTLHQHGHGHSHGGGGSHSHDNINVRAAFIHVVGDFLQSIGVFTAALVIYFKNDWVIVDPICTFIFSLFVLATTLTILKDTINVLMEGIPNGVDIETLHELLEQIPGVFRVHNLRVWSLSLDKPALSAHLVIDSDVKPQDVLAEATLLVRAKYDFYEMTLQIEEYHEQMQNCDQCLGTANRRQEC